MRHFCGKRSLKTHSLPRARMVKLKSVSVQALTRNVFCVLLRRAALVAAVNFVTENGMPEARHVHADLMRSARFELAFDQRNAVKTFFYSPMSNRFTRAAVADDSHTLAVNGMAADWCIHSSRILAGRADADGKIAPISRVKRDLLGKRAVRGIVLGNH